MNPDKTPKFAETRNHLTLSEYHLHRQNLSYLQYEDYFSQKRADIDVIYYWGLWWLICLLLQSSHGATFVEILPHLEPISATVSSSYLAMKHSQNVQGKVSLPYECVF